VTDNAAPPSDTHIPNIPALLWPTLRAVRDIGGSGTIDEINDRVVDLESFSEAQQAVLHLDGPRTEIEYRLAWARTYLKGMGAVVNSERGVWSVTEAGREMTEGDLPGLLRDYKLALRNARLARRGNGSDSAAELEGEESDEPDWKEKLLEALLALSPERFEHLARRLLLEAGFTSARVTGRSGDEGIDGIGIYRLSLVSFPVFFQCKRYRGTVRAGAVRDFRGAMAGRGERGLLITTGTYTAEAKQEATRDGASPIDLIDGDRLCELLKEYRLGVRTELRQVEDVIVDTAFFREM
jgi:restriction system protein